MVFGDALTKAGRLVEMQRLFWRNPRRPTVVENTSRPHLRELAACNEDRQW